jgi:D-glycerate 3-kinase
MSAKILPDFALMAPQVSDLIEVEHLPADFVAVVERWYLPIAARIAQAQSQQAGTLLVSISGAQGSGKSTLTAFLKLLLKAAWQLDAVDISLDDFYLTHTERQQLALAKHPLLATRGVPGTHDLALATAVFAELRQCSVSQPCQVPRFDKSVDDRRPAADWTVVDHGVDVILFEGWCNNAPVATAESLREPINRLETQEDPDGSWRHYVNACLGRYHQALFSQADLLVHIAIPSFDKVYEWRQLQEQKLAEKAEANAGVMDSVQLSRFIQHYERITRRCLEELPKTADIVLNLNAEHGVDGLLFRPPG